MINISIYSMASSVILGIITAILWGIGYTMLVPVSKQLSTYTIATLYGAALSITNFIVGTFYNNVENYYLLVDPKIGFLFLGYVIIFVSANFIYLAGYRAAPNAGTYVAITSTYPLFTFLFSYLFYNTANVNWGFVIPGMLLIISGVILLAMGK